MSASQKFMGVVKGLILSYLLTIIMLFITAVVVYKVGISDKVLGILVVVIYIVATFAGGFVTGRKVREKRFVGMVYGLDLHIGRIDRVGAVYRFRRQRGNSSYNQVYYVRCRRDAGGYAQLKKLLLYISLCYNPDI